MAVLHKLIGTADVILNNYRPGVMQKMGLDRATLERLKPGIVSAHITGFGLDGPYRDRPAFDFIAQAMSGFMSVNGAEGEPPARAAPPITDLIAGAYAAMGVCAALVRHARTGQGEEVATSLTDSMVSTLSFLATNYFATGELPTRTGNDHALVAPYGLFDAADGQVAIAPSNDQVYFKLLDALGLVRNCARTRTSSPIATASRGATRSTRASTPRRASGPSRTGSRCSTPPACPAGACWRWTRCSRIRRSATSRCASRSTIRSTGRSTCWASRSSSPTIRAACIARRPTWAQDADALLAELGYAPERIAALREAQVV